MRWTLAPVPPARLLPLSGMQLPLLPELLLPLSTVKPPSTARVYCNRSLRLDLIEWVGFDMDYTLAIYDQAAMDQLGIEATAVKLVERGYPERLLRMPYRTDFPIRGLLIDRQLGNILKMDRYRYVKKAYHGMRELSRDERGRIYHSRRIAAGSSRYHWVDTLYALSEVTIYAAAVDELEKNGSPIDYDRLFGDIRECIDLAHRDGSILERVLEDLPRFVHRDECLGKTLHTLRSSGKGLFLLTNSQPAFIETMMSYLLDDALPEYPSWRHYFDRVIAAARKPTFFTEEQPFHLPDGTTVEPEHLEKGATYMGGNIGGLERSLGVRSDQILYVGDHIYGDALRLKKEAPWRTAMILQEMHDEHRALESCTKLLERMDRLDEERDRINDRLREHQRRARNLQNHLEERGSDRSSLIADLGVAKRRERRSVERLKRRLHNADLEHSELEIEVDRAFHPFWGSIFKAGPEVTIFGDQVEQYACLYMSRVSNLLHYSPMHFFRSPRDRMPHEL